MNIKDVSEITCPYCGETNAIYVDYSGGGSQTYEEDCQVCCRTWRVHIELSGDGPNVTVTRDDE